VDPRIKELFLAFFGAVVRRLLFRLLFALHAQALAVRDPHHKAVDRRALLHDRGAYVHSILRR